MKLLNIINPPTIINIALNKYLLYLVVAGNISYNDIYNIKPTINAYINPNILVVIYLLSINPKTAPKGSESADISNRVNTFFLFLGFS